MHSQTEVSSSNGQGETLDTVLKQMWQDAVQEYNESRGRSGSQISPSPSNQEIVSLESLESFVKGSEDDFKLYRARREKLITALKSTLGPIQAIGNLASGAVSNVCTFLFSQPSTKPICTFLTVSQVFAPSSSIFSAVSFLVKVVPSRVLTDEQSHIYVGDQRVLIVRLVGCSKC